MMRFHNFWFFFTAVSSYHSAQCFESTLSLIEEKKRQLRGKMRNHTYTTSHEEYKWKRVLDEIIDGVDLCLNGNEYGICNPRRFPTCEEGTRICMYRQPRTDLFYDRLHHDPAYYIDYNKIQCVPHWNDEKGRKWNCNLCDPGVWCKSLNRCVKRKKRFCPDNCDKAEYRKWCPSQLKCLRFRKVDGKPKEECSDWS